MVAPMVGAAIAAPLYWFVIEANHPPDEDPERDHRSVNPQLGYES